MPVAHMDSRQADGSRCEFWMGDKDNSDSEMLRVIVNEGDKIEKALKTFKRKVNNTKLIQECRQRQEFHKPSETARRQRLKARYVQQLRNTSEL